MIKYVVIVVIVVDDVVVVVVVVEDVNLSNQIQKSFYCQQERNEEQY